MCRCDVQRRCASGKHSGHRESHSGIGRKPFAFPPESLFAFSPESRSPSPRNAFHVHPGILFAFARNPQFEAEIEKRMEPYGEQVEGLMTIPGVERIVAWHLIAELGVDTSVFADADHCASWAGLTQLPQFR